MRTPRGECNSSCSEVFTESIRLVAEAGAAGKFRGWSGACSGEALECVVSSSGAVQASFDVVSSTRLVTVETVGPGSVLVGGASCRGRGDGFFFPVRFTGGGFDLGPGITSQNGAWFVQTGATGSSAPLANSFAFVPHFALSSDAAWLATVPGSSFTPAGAPAPLVDPTVLIHHFPTKTLRWHHFENSTDIVATQRGDDALVLLRGRGVRYNGRVLDQSATDVFHLVLIRGPYSAPR